MLREDAELREDDINVTLNHMFECPVCFAAVSVYSREKHEGWHAAQEKPHRLPFEVEDGASVQTEAQYGVEFADEPADRETYETLQEARIAEADYRADEKDGADITGMRIMTRTVTTIFGPWKEYGA